MTVNADIAQEKFTSSTTFLTSPYIKNVELTKILLKYNNKDDGLKNQAFRENQSEILQQFDELKENMKDKQRQNKLLQRLLDQKDNELLG